MALRSAPRTNGQQRIRRGGEVHRIAVPDWAALARDRSAVGVGFFGQARADVDHEPIVVMEDEIVERAASLDGLLAYHNALLEPGRWANLVVFASVSAVDALRGDAVHEAAIALTPVHYASLRLHRGRSGGRRFGRCSVRPRANALLRLLRAAAAAVRQGARVSLAQDRHIRDHCHMAVSAVAGRLELLERESVLEALRDAAREAESGRGQLVLLAGDAGVGKTALLRAFVDGLEAPRRVHWGACDPLFPPHAAGAVRRPRRQLGRRAPVRHRAGLQPA